MSTTDHQHGGIAGVADQRWAQASFRADAPGARAARRFVADQLAESGAEPSDVADVVLVVGELVTNVIEHTPGARHVVVGVGSTGDTWTLEVASPAPDPTALVWSPEAWAVADQRAASGRGLGIVARLMDEVSTSARDGQIVIRLRRRR